ncbi:MAG: EamA family transporter RarD [Aquabacterium sp.]
MRSGPLAALGCYTIWGLFPLYLKLLAGVSALELVAHRSAWALVLLLLLLAAQRRLGALRQALASPAALRVFVPSALLLSLNWLLYVYAVNGGRVLEASLGYFINPLVNVALGFLFLRERLRAAQWLAIALAAAGVAWLTWQVGALPWVSLALALSFGVYGLLRKTAPLGALEGLALETTLLAPLALAGVAWFMGPGHGAFASGSLGIDLLVVGTGVLTAITLVLFAYAARQVTLATLGLMQYLSPSLQFVLAVYVFNEPFDTGRGVGFALIWAGLLVYSVHGLVQMRQARVAST